MASDAPLAEPYFDEMPPTGYLRRRVLATAMLHIAAVTGVTLVGERPCAGLDLGGSQRRPGRPLP